ncbi:hypothetical protein FB567DRAFT_547712 [Paraphoma chrysanthemicola]|uniref:Uncharacterized protein n=1 Tax=Paraphoma chrysanthemicola TaxID=798071 RepID=A0A8K0R950_9PLEO|nr:hypothetical protein FB567DRAFT_547712 [Paraphoma chrysanthemicola]
MDELPQLGNIDNPISSSCAYRSLAPTDSSTRWSATYGPQQQASYGVEEISESSQMLHDRGLFDIAPWHHLHLSQAYVSLRSPSGENDPSYVLEDAWFSDEALEASNVGVYHVSQALTTPVDDDVYGLVLSTHDGLDEIGREITRSTCSECGQYFTGTHRHSNMRRHARIRHTQLSVQEEKPPAIPPDFRLPEEGAGLYSLASNMKAQYSEVI